MYVYTVKGIAWYLTNHRGTSYLTNVAAISTIMSRTCIQVLLYRSHLADEQALAAVGVIDRHVQPRAEHVLMHLQ